jgi:hypothetical protein
LRSGEFGEVILLGDLSPELLADTVCPIRQLPVPAALLDARGRVPVAALIRLGARARRAPGCACVVTDRDLAFPGCRSLFGFADRRARVAVISTAWLADPTDPSRLRERLRGEMAHEMGHLNGLDHCPGPDCLMTPVTTAAQLDARPEAPCGRCPVALPLWTRLLRQAAGLAVLVLLAILLNLPVSLLSGPPLQIPFT